MRKLRQMSPKKAMILYGVCTVLWTAIVVMDVVSGTYKDDMSMFIMKAICVPAWIAVFVMAVKRYRSDKDGK